MKYPIISKIWDKSIFTTLNHFNQPTNQPINDICIFAPFYDYIKMDVF